MIQHRLLLMYGFDLGRVHTPSHGLAAHQCVFVTCIQKTRVPGFDLISSPLLSMLRSGCHPHIERRPRLPSIAKSFPTALSPGSDPLTMCPEKTHMSSSKGSCAIYSATLFDRIPSTVISSFVKQALGRFRERIHRTRSGGASPETSTACSLPTARLPQEIVDMIIAYLIHDASTLRACSLTCYSLYIASVPHIHPTLYVTLGHKNQNLEWAWSSRMLNLFPFVETVQIHSGHTSSIFSPRIFNPRTLSQFSALTNVSRLEIQKVDIPSFMRCTQPYLGHFLPTVRSLTLSAPQGSRRQIIFFIGLFQNLQNLSLFDSTLGIEEREPADDLTLIPSFTPPLRGRLMVWRVARVGLWKDMVRLLGGIQFTDLIIYDVDEAQFLLSACADTLQSVRLYPEDPRGEYLCLSCNIWPTVSQPNPTL